MWDQFRAYYQLAKKSAAPSALDPLIGLLGEYPSKGSLPHLQKIRAEIKRVSGVTRWFSQNPVKKYSMALMALKDELDAEELRLRETASEKTAKAKQLEINQAARRHAYAKMLESRKTDKEYCEPITASFKRMCLEEKFNQYLLDEIGWTNATSWLNWAIRAATPSMQSGWAAEDAKRLMRAMALKASVSGHIYMERYFLELSIYCAAAKEKADIGVVFEQASLVFGPLIGPALGIPADGVWSYVYKGGKKLTEAATTGLTQKALVSSAEPSVTSTENGKQVTQNVNLMRFTHAWLKYVINETASDDMKVVMKEFGDRRGCVNLLEALAEL